ncbi:MAG: polymer-forming cytoskeletal protein [Nannocystaceae bacterium]|nr:polymer-forming cytoskeletal protein [Myxococcales bacterium]
MARSSSTGTSKAGKGSGSAIASGTVVRGAVSGDEDLDVEGRLEGSLSLAGALHVAEGAAVEADVEARGIEVAGQLSGAVTAGELITIHASAQVTGSLRAPRIAIAEGASFHGIIEMDVELPGELRRPGH